jgi:anti-anti-sigma regulatory factor
MNLDSRPGLNRDEMTIRTIILDCATADDPDAGTVERIAQVKLAARRNAVDLRLVNVRRSLFELIDLCGLAEVLRVEPEGQPE